MMNSAIQTEAEKLRGAIAALQSAECAVEELCHGQDPANQCWVVLKEIRDAIAAAGSHISLSARFAA